jgi:hypothetical protein
LWGPASRLPFSSEHSDEVKDPASARNQTPVIQPLARHFIGFAVQAFGILNVYRKDPWAVCCTEILNMVYAPFVAVLIDVE